MMRCTRFLMICLATMIGGYGMAAAAPTVIDLTQTGLRRLFVPVEPHAGLSARGQTVIPKEQDHGTT